MIKSALLCLALSVFYESRGEPIEGQYAVAEVVLNRASDRNLSVCEVIYEKNQFQNANKWKIPNENNKDWQKSLLVASNSDCSQASTMSFFLPSNVAAIS